MSFVEKARDVEARLREIFPPTPLMRNQHLSEKYGADIWLKREDLSPVRSYKLRGAFNAMRKALAINPDQELFVCASAGNHAQGVAFMCNQLGRKGVIFMPITTPAQKITKTKMFGGPHVSVELTGDYFDDTLQSAQAYARDHAGHFLSPFDDADVIEGQASVAVEIEQRLGGAPDCLVVPVGGGGLASGLIGYFSTNTEYHLVEPTGAPSLTQALHAGAPVDVSPINSFVDGASVAKIGAQNFKILKSLRLEQVRLIEEDRVCATIVEMLNLEGIVLEPAGALSLEALSDIADLIKGQTVVCVVSGGNFDFERLPEVKERAQRYLGLKKYLVLRLPQRPGALKDFLNILGPEDDIARFEYLKKSARNFGTVLIGIETSQRHNFTALFQKLDDQGFTYSDITNDETLTQLVV